MLQNFTYWKNCLNAGEQQQLLSHVRDIINAAPLYTPRMPKSGAPFSVRMTNCGSLGWVSDKEGGYRYQASHPETGNPWPAMPEMLLELWDRLTGYPHRPEACLVNAYTDKAKMGLHLDRDEQDFSAPVLSISLGASCKFRIGGSRRKDPTRSLQLDSGDVVALAGDDRLAYHGVDRIIKNSSDLLSEALPDIARINLTLRRVAPFSS